MTDTVTEQDVVEVETTTEAPTNNGGNVTPLNEKFNIDLRESMEARMVERTRETQTAVVALVSRVHHFQLGPPGVAKSLLVRTLVDHIDGFGPEDYFERLLTRFSTPEEVFGPPSLHALKQDVYKRNIHGMLPTAKIAFVDEIFKANSSILNSLLAAMNERVFYNDVPIDIPLSTMFSASNELPQGEELDAMYDRIHFRHIMRPIQEPGNFIQMLKGQIAGPVVPVVTWEEVETAQDQVKAVVVPDDVLEAFNTLRNNLKAQGIEPTDRRFAQCLQIVRGTAWLDGRGTADIDDMKLLRHVLWTTQAEIPHVERLVLELANPLDKEAMDLMEQVEKLAVELDDAIKNSDNKQALHKKGIELHGKLERAKAELDTLQKRSEKANRKSDVMAQLETRLLGVIRTLLKEIFRIDPNSGTANP